jgi:hypothetical protein
MTMKHARDMDPKEYAATLAALIKAGSQVAEPPPPSDDQPKMAKDMTSAEQEAFLKEHKKKYR